MLEYWRRYLENRRYYITETLLDSTAPDPFRKFRSLAECRDKVKDFNTANQRRTPSA